MAHLNFHPVLAGVALAALVCSPALGDIDPLSGIDFVRVGAVGNAPWAGDGTPGDRAIGRGGVGYAYSIGKYEVTSGQWAEFFTAVQSCPDGRVPWVRPPEVGGNAAYPMMPTGGITWRTAAIFTNWLNNSKDNHLASFMNGAYDVGTFGQSGDSFTDQLTHNPGARYWIPTWDEWLKAAHYDPDKNGPGVGGWWKFSNGSDSPVVYGLPGEIANGQLAQANAGGGNIMDIPLGSYASHSPLGLYDVAGETSEWVEEAMGAAGRHEVRFMEGSSWGSSPGTSTAADSINFVGGDYPSYGFSDFGFRVASSVPAPGTCAAGVAFLVVAARRSRRQGGFHAQSASRPVERAPGSEHIVGEPDQGRV